MRQKLDDAEKLIIKLHARKLILVLVFRFIIKGKLGKLKLGRTLQSARRAAIHYVALSEAKRWPTNKVASRAEQSSFGHAHTRPGCTTCTLFYTFVHLCVCMCKRVRLTFPCRACYMRAKLSLPGGWRGWLGDASNIPWQSF